MNIKTSQSAVKNKLFLASWFILFAGLIVLVNWLLLLPLNRSEALIDRLTDTDKQLTRLTAFHAQFLLNRDKEDNLFNASNENIQNEIKQATLNITGHINAFKDNPHIARKASAVLDEFAGNLSAFESGMNNLVLITYERGDKNSGLVKRWLALSRQMLDGTTEKDMQQSLQRIKQLESEYLLNRDIKTLQDISIAAEEVRSAITMEVGGINLEDMDSYMVLTGNLVSIEKRMGHTDAQGIIPDLERSLRQLPADFINISILVRKQVTRSGMFWTLIRIAALLLVVTIIVYLFVRIFSLIDPLQKLSGFTKKIAAGDFPEDDPDVGNLADMQAIKESLQQHIVFLKDKLHFTQSLNLDVFDAELKLAGENDHLGSALIQLQQKILETNEKQIRNEEDNLVRRYINEGLARFGDILRSKNNDILLLGDAFIREMVKYLNAVQGGFFIYDDSEPSDPVLKLISAFAYDRKKFLEHSIKYGEGLIGSCAREKLYMNLTEIPPGYITITSGLGDTSPGNLLLVPVLHENEILGVVEIASLNLFKKHEIEFAQEVALNLGSTLVNTRNNQRTSELLTKSQQQALEMAEQEEEMRQNMEELKATQEESTRREEEFRGIAEAIGNALMVIEYDLEGKIQEVNQNLCRFIGRDHDDVIGKYHHEVFEGGMETDVNFWKEVQQNGHLSIAETIRIGKKPFEIREHFAPVTNNNNSTVKYINFAFNGRIGNS
jgi:PAS domain-containing protein